MTAMLSATREIERSVRFDLIRADDQTGDGLTLEGYAAVFGQPTEIDSWEGTFTETIRKGAFRKSLRERTPVMQFDHGRHPLVGSIPIGAIQDLREDDEGLFTSARLSNNWLIEPVRQAIADGSIDGMSFRFEVVRDEWRDNTGKLVKPDELMHLLWNAGDRGPLERTLVEVKVRELGPVVFPAYEGTSVGVRARDMAAEIADDDQLRREVRRSLAQATAEPTDLSDPEMLREVARALLFGPEISDAPPDGHPSDEQDELSDGEPLRDEHPPDDTDAPPPDGHPSADQSTRELLRSRIKEITGLMEDVLKPIKEQ